MVKLVGNKKKIFLYSNVIMVITEIILIYLIIIGYKGVYDVEYLIPVCIVQLFFIAHLIRNHDSTSRFALITIPLILFVFLAFIIRAPQYTYTEGKSLIADQLPTKENIEFIPLDFSLSTIPSSKLSNRILDNGRIYYYKIHIDRKCKYFVVNQYTGDVQELSTDYWDCY